jgi:hypothetical protein
MILDAVCTLNRECRIGNNTWKIVVGDLDDSTGIDKPKTLTVKMPKTVEDINHARHVCRHKGEALLRKTDKNHRVNPTRTLNPSK